MTIRPMPQTIPLTSDQCAAMLASEAVGRLVLADTPRGTPMSYEMDAGVLVVRVDAASSVARATGQWARFEVDHYDQQARAGWSVVARGVLEDVAASAGGTADAEARAPGRDREERRLQPRQLTGRLVLAEPLYPSYPPAPEN